MQNLKVDNKEELKYSKLINLVDYKKGKKPNTLEDENKKGYIPYIDIEAFERGVIKRYTNEKNITVCDKDKDILIVWDGRVGLVGVASGAVGSTLMKLTPKSVNRDYLLYFLTSKFSDINSNFRGTIIPHINPDYFWALEVPVPSLEIQELIVRRVSKQIPLINENNQRITRARKMIVASRQAILSAAITGKLTEKWRQQNPNIKSQITYLQRKDGSYHVTPYEIESWCVANLAAVAEKIVDCPHSTPKWSTEGEVCVRTTNFNPFNLDLSSVKYVTLETFNERNSRLIPKAGDVLYSREGGILGIACQIPEGARVCLGQRMMLIRGNEEIVRNEYITLFLNSEIILSKVRSLITGSAAPHLNVGEVKNFDIFLPSLAEQDEILRKVKKYFEIANKIEKQIEIAELGVSNLTQAILTKTFNSEI